MAFIEIERLRSKCEQLESIEKAIAIKLAETLDVGDEILTAEGNVKKRPYRGKTYLSNLKNEHFLSIAINTAKDSAKSITDSLKNSKRLKSEIFEVQENGYELFLKSYKEIKEKKVSNSLLISSADDMKQELGESTSALIQESSKKVFEEVNKAIEFSGEEFYGRCLDLHVHFQKFINLVSGQKKLNEVRYMDYIDRVGVFSCFGYSETKCKDSYVEYLSSLVSYLHSFRQKTQPLVDLDFSQTLTDFEVCFMSGEMEGWRSEFPKDSVLVEKLEKETVDLRKELVFRGLKIGGREEDKRQRLRKSLGKFTEKEFKVENVGVKLPCKTYGKKVSAGKNFNPKEVASLEYLVGFLLNKLPEAINKTKERVTKKATQSYREIRAEEEVLEQAERQLIIQDKEAEGQMNGEEERDLGQSNSNLPIGRDGNPIPRWLYKMNGMNFEYKCEICGNASYQGRINFERHFQESRHASGMKLLGIPNTKHFQSITKIEDARELYLKLQRQVNDDFAIEEEFETNDGRKVVHRQNLSFV